MSRAQAAASGVAREERHVAPVGFDDAGHAPEVVVQDLRHALGARGTFAGEALGELRESSQVDEQRGGEDRLLGRGDGHPVAPRDSSEQERRQIRRQRSLTDLSLRQ